MKSKYFYTAIAGRRSSGSRTSANQKGVTLIEVLVAVLLLSFGLLGMAALQTRALQGNQSSLQRSQAIMLTNYMMDAMRVDREEAKGGAYNIGLTCGPSGISGSTLAKNNLRDWLTTSQTSLSVATDTAICGTVSCDANFFCKVSIQWDDSKAGGVGNQTLAIESKL
jgi:type IV pilus assembly protein PilV